MIFRAHGNLLLRKANAATGGFVFVVHSIDRFPQAFEWKKFRALGGV